MSRDLEFEVAFSRAIAAKLKTNVCNEKIASLHFERQNFTVICDLEPIYNVGNFQDSFPSQCALDWSSPIQASFKKEPKKPQYLKHFHFSSRTQPRTKINDLLRTLRSISQNQPQHFHGPHTISTLHSTLTAQRYLGRPVPAAVTSSRAM